MIETLFNIAVRISLNAQRTMIDTLFNVAARCLIAAAFMPWRGGSPLGRVTGVLIVAGFVVGSAAGLPGHIDIMLSLGVGCLIAFMLTMWQRSRVR